MSAVGRREIVIEEIKCMEEERRTVQAISQPQQGAWTAWEMVLQKKVSWASLWKMEPQRLIFALKSMCDQMTTAVNLAKWKLAESVECTKCGRRETLEHVLSGCPKSLARYTWRHNQVL